MALKHYIIKLKKYSYTIDKNTIIYNKLIFNYVWLEKIFTSLTDVEHDMNFQVIYPLLENLIISNTHR